MASVLEHFNSDFRDLMIVRDLPISFHNKLIVTLQQKIQIDQFNDCRTLAFYIPDIQNTAIICEFILSDIQKSVGLFNGLKVSVDKKEKAIGERNNYYSNRIFLYSENELTPFEFEKLKEIAKQKNLYVILRSQEYIKQRKEEAVPKAFISHDSRDKDLVARPIAQGLQSRACFTWYDEFSLNIGDSLRHSIEKGIKEAKKCILILSKNYFSNPGWGRKEFDSIFTRELVMEERIILPVWFEVSKKEVYDFSPSLVDTLALVWPSKKNKSDLEYKTETEPLLSKLHTQIIK